MAEHQCDANSHSSDPVPIIGFYIAVASLVCLLLIILDIFFAFRRKARYIPCRFFPLNSVTITLLAIVTKLPVDLTTNMPSARDQLSKLTGTTMICICMGFMAPSLATSRKSECIANMASLSIFIVTVVVNIYVQMRTGVIFSFVPEHITIMCFMCILLFTLWLHISYDKERVSRQNVRCFEKNIGGQGEQISLIYRVKSWYISACLRNPQLTILRVSHVSTTAGPICVMCSLVLLQAIYRSLVVQSIEFCVGVSDYGWSMWIVVTTQVLTIIVGTLTIAFRWLAIFHYFNIHNSIKLANAALSTVKHMFSGRRSILNIGSNLFWFVIAVFLIFINVPMYAISFIISRIPREIKPKLRCCMHKATTDISSWIKEYYEKEMMDGLRRQLIERCVDDMKKWKNVCVSHHMVHILSAIDFSKMPQLLNSFEEIGKKKTRKDDYNGKTCLLFVVLGKVVAACVPDPLNPIIKSMVDTLGEAFEIVYYVDKKTNVKREDSKKQKLARKLWKDEDFYLSMNKVLMSKNPYNLTECTITSIQSAYNQIIFGYGMVDSTLIENELNILSDFMKKQRYATMDDLYGDVRQLFCEILHHFLAQLPICVYKDVRDGPLEDCEERAIYLTKRLCKLDPLLEDKVQWKFPDGWPADTTRIFDGSCSATATQNVPSPTHHKTTNAKNDISTEDKDGGCATTSSAQYVVMAQLTHQHSTDKTHPTDASDNV